MAPAVDATFNIPVMTAFAVGPAWASASAEDKAALIAAFRKYTIANYAKNFDSYNGEKITVDPMVLTRLPGQDGQDIHDRRRCAPWCWAIACARPVRPGR